MIVDPLTNFFLSMRDHRSLYLVYLSRYSVSRVYSRQVNSLYFSDGENNSLESYTDEELCALI